MAKVFTFIFIFTLLASGCKRANEAPGQGEGTISMSLACSQAMESLDEPIDDCGTTLGNFRLLIYSGQTLLKKWNRYSDLTGYGNVRQGTHKVVAFYGDSTKVGFSKPYYYGESPVTIVPGKVTPVSVTAGLRNVRISVCPDADFLETHSDLSVLLYTSGTRLTFTPEETRSAFAPPADIRFRVSFTNTDGEQKIYIPPTVKDVKPGEHIKLNLKNGGGTFSLNIEKDLSTDDKELVFEIPKFMLPKPAPEFAVTGFTDNRATYTEGFTENARIGIYAPGQIRECILKVESPFLRANGWPEEFDLLTLDADTKKVLERDSLKWDEMADNTSGNIDFSSTLGLLSPGDHTFTLKVTDGVGQTVTSTTYTAHVDPARFDYMSPEGMAWARHIETGITITDANPEKFKLQRFADGRWIDLPAEQTLNEAGDSLQMEAWGFNPQTAYKVRVCYNNSSFGPETEFTTEKEEQVPGRDFETWSEQMCYKKTTLGMGIEIYEVFPYDYNIPATKYWDTRNALTTSDKSGTSTYYNQYSGTRSVQGPTGMAAEISTVNWGSGSTFPGGAGIKKNITAGMIFIGDYDLSARTENMGRSFPSRPEGVRFDYKFAQIGEEPFDAWAVVEHRAEDGTVTELGRAIIDPETAKTAMGDFTKGTIKFEYTNKNLAATHISIAFKSSSSDNPNVNPVKGSLGPFKAYADSKYIGNVLTVDNVELIYTKL